MHEVTQRKDKSYSGGTGHRKLIRRKWRCSCGFKTHSDAKMSAHLISRR